MRSILRYAFPAILVFATLVLAIVVDTTILVGIPVATLYAIPVLIAAYFYRWQVVVAVSAVAFASNLTATSVQRIPFGLAIAYVIGLAVALSLVSLLAALLSSQRDTQRRLREEATRKTTEVQTVIESIADLVLVVDAQGTVITANGPMRRLLGKSAGEPLGTIGDAARTLRISYPDGRLVPVDDLPVNRALRQV